MPHSCALFAQEWECCAQIKLSSSSEHIARVEGPPPFVCPLSRHSGAARISVVVLLKGTASESVLSEVEGCRKMLNLHPALAAEGSFRPAMHFALPAQIPSLHPLYLNLRPAQGAPMLHHSIEALRMTGIMAWQILWALSLGFLLSSIVEAVVSKAQLSKLLPRLLAAHHPQGHRPRRRLLLLLLRRHRARPHPLPQGGRLHRLHGLPVRLHQPGRRTQRSPLRPPRLAVHGGRVLRRSHHDRPPRRSSPRHPAPAPHRSRPRPRRPRPRRSHGGPRRNGHEPPRGDLPAKNLLPPRHHRHQPLLLDGLVFARPRRRPRPTSSPASSPPSSRPASGRPSSSSAIPSSPASGARSSARSSPSSPSSARSATSLSPPSSGTVASASAESSASSSPTSSSSPSSTSTASTTASRSPPSSPSPSTSPWPAQRSSSKLSSPRCISSPPTTSSSS